MTLPQITSHANTIGIGGRGCLEIFRDASGYVKALRCSLEHVSFDFGEAFSVGVHPYMNNFGHFHFNMLFL